MICNCESKDYHDITCVEFDPAPGAIARRTDDEVHELGGLQQLDKDWLMNIFCWQRRFMDKLGIPCLDGEGHSKMLDVNEFTKMLTNYSLTCTTAIGCETTELLDALPWKPWKKSYEMIDLNNVHIEIVDMMHFVVELAIIWGMKPHQLHDLYMKKMQENIDRQNKGY